MDVKNAFLQGDLDEEVHMQPPPGLIINDDRGKVCRLRKAIYGLKQSPRAGCNKLSNVLVGEGFKKSEADHSILILQRETGIVILLIYVDDLTLTRSDEAGISWTKSLLNLTFDIKDLGELRYFLGIEVTRSSNELFLSQRKYTLDLSDDAGKLGSKPAKAPLQNARKDRKRGELYPNVEQYQRTVGKLICLTITGPDISFAVNQASQRMQQPRIEHWMMVDRILRYLKGSPGQGIRMRNNGHHEVIGCCDADWAGDLDDRKSTIGCCTFVGGNLVTRKSKKQTVIARSSAEAEYRAMAATTCELVWLRSLLDDLGLKTTTPMVLHCDNQAAIHIATNPVFHERTKHIAVDCHFIREKIQKEVILPGYVRSEEQQADVFTKATSVKISSYMYNKLGLCDPHIPSLRGNVKESPLKDDIACGANANVPTSMNVIQHISGAKHHSSDGRHHNSGDKHTDKQSLLLDNRCNS